MTKTDTVPTLTEISKEDKDKTSNYTKVKEALIKGYAKGMGSDSDLILGSQQDLSEELSFRDWKMSRIAVSQGRRG